MDAIRKEHDTPLLQVEGLTKYFGGVKAQEDISFGVERGTILGLIGPNGAGKTTLFNMITGAYAPDRGEIFLNGRALGAMPVHERVVAGIARTFQNVELFPGMTVLENVLVGMHVRLKSGFWGGVLRLPKVVQEEKQARKDALGILEFTELLSYAERPAGDLPVGRQKIAEIARALASDPVLILLDEPAAGLNRVETRALGKLICRIKERGITLILVEHDMGLAMEVCDNILVLDRGEAIAFGTPLEVRNNRRVMDAYLGEDFQCLN